MSVNNEEFLSLISMLYTDNIQVSISDLSKTVTKEKTSYSFDELLLKSIREKIEGKCNSHGLVRSKTTKILSRNMGMYVPEFFTGTPVYSCTYTTEILNPTKGVILPCHVKVKNKIGLMAHLDIKNKTFIVALVPFQLPNRGADQETQKNMIEQAVENSGKNIFVEVVGSKFEMNDKYITVIGNIVEESKFEKFIKSCNKVSLN